MTCSCICVNSIHLCRRTASLNQPIAWFAPNQPPASHTHSHTRIFYIIAIDSDAAGGIRSRTILIYTSAAHVLLMYVKLLCIFASLLHESFLRLHRTHRPYTNNLYVFMIYNPFLTTNLFGYFSSLRTSRQSPWNIFVRSSSFFSIPHTGIYVPDLYNIYTICGPYSHLCPISIELYALLTRQKIRLRCPEGYVPMYYSIINSIRLMRMVSIFGRFFFLFFFFLSVSMKNRGMFL